MATTFLHRPVLAIDPSLTGFCFALEGPETPLVLKEIKTQAKDWPKTLDGRLRRFRSIVRIVEECAKNYAPKLLLIEGYAFAAKGNSSVTLGELGGILRDHVVDYCDAAVEVAPPTLKKFATGKGVASKLAVVQAVGKRYGCSFTTDNEADAFALVKLGQCVVGYTQPKTKPQKEAVEVVAALLRQELYNG